MKQSEILGCGGMGLGWVQNSRGGGGEEKEEEDLDYINIIFTSRRRRSWPFRTPAHKERDFERDS
jgi:hypothetical protein